MLLLFHPVYSQYKSTQPLRICKSKREKVVSQSPQKNVTSSTSFFCMNLLLCLKGEFYRFLLIWFKALYKPHTCSCLLVLQSLNGTKGVAPLTSPTCWVPTFQKSCTALSQHPSCGYTINTQYSVWVTKTLTVSACTCTGRLHSPWQTSHLSHTWVWKPLRWIWSGFIFNSSTIPTPHCSSSKVWHFHSVVWCHAVSETFSVEVQHSTQLVCQT